MRLGTASRTPQTLVVFGGSGDLTRRKLLPALYDVACEGLLPERYAIVTQWRTRALTASLSATPGAKAH